MQCIKIQSMEEYINCFKDLMNAIITIRDEFSPGIYKPDLLKLRGLNCEYMSLIMNSILSKQVPHIEEVFIVMIAQENQIKWMNSQPLTIHLCIYAS